MPIYAATVTIKKRDNTMTRTVENVVVSGDTQENMKRSFKNLQRAVRYSDLSKNEDVNRWLITDIIIHKELGLL